MMISISILGVQNIDKLALGQGFAASPGAAVGNLALNIDEAVKMCNEGVKTILVLPDATYDDEEVLKVSEQCKVKTIKIL